MHTSQWQYRGILWHVAHKILLCIVCIYRLWFFHVPINTIPDRFGATAHSYNIPPSAKLNNHGYYFNRRICVTHMPGHCTHNSYGKPSVSKCHSGSWPKQYIHYISLKCDKNNSCYHPRILTCGDIKRGHCVVPMSPWFKYSCNTPYIR